MQSLVLADEWDENYERGKAALERGEWQIAIERFQLAVSNQPIPDQQAATSSLKLIEYLPYFGLGQAYFYSGNYSAALINFSNSVDAGAIERTPHLRTLEHLQRICRSLLAYQGQQVQASADKKKDVQILEIQSLIQQQKFAEAESRLAVVFDDDLRDTRRAIIQGWLTSEKRFLKEKQLKQAADAKVAREFELGLDLFVQGRYQEALQHFRQAEVGDPGFENARSWRSRTEAEIRRISDVRLPDTVFTTEETIVERVIRETTAPVFAFRSPTRSSFETRSPSLWLSGNAGDDKGIAFIEMIVNGKSVIDSTGSRLKLTPGLADDPSRFAFEANIPLNLGENQIVLTAYDVDSVTHRTIERFTVLRHLPIYKTAGFFAIVAAGLALIIGGFLLSRHIKYRIAFVSKYNPYIAGAPIRNDEMFFGREKLLKRILNTLHNNSLMIHGPRRIGKTSLQHQLKARLESLDDPDYFFVPVFIDLQGTSERHFFSTLMEEIIETCKPHIHGQAFRFNYNNDNYSGRDMSRDLRNLLHALRDTTAKKLKLVLLIDEVDELNKYSEQANQRLRSIFMKTFAENLVAVMSGAYIRKKWDSEGSPWYNFFEEIEVPPFDRNDAVRLVEEPVHGIFEFEKTAVDKIIEYSECRPYEIQKVCVHVINRIIDEKRRYATASDVEAILPNLTRSHREEQLMF